MLASDAVQLIFQRGEFDSNATYMVAQALTFLSFAIIPYVFRDSITRVFYSFNDSKTPFIVAMSSIILKFILNYLFIDKLGIAAITLSTSLVTLFNATLLGIILLKKINLGYTTYFKNLIKMVLAAVLAFGLSFVLYKYWTINNSYILLTIKTISVFILSMVIYTIIAAAFKIEYVGELLERIKEYFRRKILHR